ncbi:MAG TPA: N-acetylmuramoyl-L-alanine amidase-like domain-containing protein [Blastocatellia bacterium]|nr:N-acetylmuramoyl-L-alanine amidase-like domain-containing protein [Blastocatellia bacterium]
MTETEAPLELDISEVERLLDEARLAVEPGERIELFSARFLGRAYFANPLEGGPHSPEVFKVSLRGFDCVTYMETVLALALARTADGFVERVRELRYAGGEVDWYHRNHYMIDWASNNQKLGVIQDITSGPETVMRTRRLSLIKSLPERTVSFRCFPKRALGRIRSRIETGDAVLFASTRKTLDVFHTGFLIKTGDGISLRHATRTAGRVIEQSLASFLEAHRMSGFILLRTLCHD